MSSATEFSFQLCAASWPQTLEVSPQEGKSSNPFYFEDTQVVLQASHDIRVTSYLYIHSHIPCLQVGTKKYKIHRYFLTRESEFFDDLFSLPQSEASATVEGSDDNPIKLPETPKVGIENLLRFFYYGYEFHSN